MPAEVAECAARIAELAAELAGRGNPHLRCDAEAAVVLAAAAATNAAATPPISQPRPPRRGTGGVGGGGGHGGAASARVGGGRWSAGDAAHGGSAAGWAGIHGGCAWAGRGQEAGRSDGGPGCAVVGADGPTGTTARLFAVVTTDVAASGAAFGRRAVRAPRSRAGSPTDRSRVDRLQERRGVGRRCRAVSARSPTCVR